MVATSENTAAPAGIFGVPWRIVRWVAAAAYVALLALFVVTIGVPLDRTGIALWIIAGLSVLCIGRGWRAWGRMMLDWLPFQAILLAYDFSYGAASRYTGRSIDGYPAQGAHNSVGAPLHVTFPIEVDRWVFGAVPNQWVQEHLQHAVMNPPWWSVFITACYLSHFLAAPLSAMALWIWSRRRFRQWVMLLIALAVTGITTYFLFPMAPPWLASQEGYLSGTPVYRITGQGWAFLHFRSAGELLTGAQHRSNPVAAMPSLHMATATLVIGFFWGSVPRWVRPFLLLYPALMAFSLIYGGEHYVVDEVAGVLYAVALLSVWRLLLRRPLSRPRWLGGPGLRARWETPQGEAS